MANTYSATLVAASSQYFSRASGVGVNINASDMTIECWVKLTSTPSSGNLMVLVSKYANTNAGTKQYLFYINNNAGTLELRLALQKSGSGTDVGVNYTIPTGTWVHLAVSYSNSAGDTKFYVNGVQQGATQTSITAGAQSSATPFMIGAYDTGPASFLNGLIDDVRLWTAVRTVGNISGNNQTELVGNEANLSGYWKLNNALSDSTSNANTLTNNGSIAFTTDTAFDVTLALSDTIGTTVESLSALVTIIVTLSDTIGTAVESVVTRFKFKNLAKSVISWINPDKP